MADIRSYLPRFAFNFFSVSCAPGRQNCDRQHCGRNVVGDGPGLGIAGAWTSTFCPVHHDPVPALVHRAGYRLAQYREPRLSRHRRRARRFSQAIQRAPSASLPVNFVIGKAADLKSFSAWFWGIGSALMLYGVWFDMKIE